MNRFQTPTPAGYGRTLSASCGCGRNCVNSTGGMGGCANSTGDMSNDSAGMGHTGGMNNQTRTQDAVTFETVTTGPARDALLEMLPLAMAYVPPQRWGAVYAPEQALLQGTLFPDLDLPFEGRRRGWR